MSIYPMPVHHAYPAVPVAPVNPGPHGGHVGEGFLFVPAHVVAQPNSANPTPNSHPGTPVGGVVPQANLMQQLQAAIAILAIAQAQQPH